MKHTEGSVVAFGMRGTEPVVLKVVRREEDEWNGGAVLEALAGPRYAAALEHEPGAMLTGRLRPGASLVDLVFAGGDDEATDIIAQIAAQPVGPPPAGTPAVRDWARAFRPLAGIDADAVARARDQFLGLCDTERSPRLLHGDLQHYNVLQDEERGWVAIDPKGVIGEVEFEAAAFLRNPHGFDCRRALARRAERFAAKAGADPARVVAWAECESVLSAIWSIEDSMR